MICVFRKSDGKPIGGTMHHPRPADVDQMDEDRNLIPGTQKPETEISQTVIGVKACRT